MGRWGRLTKEVKFPIVAFSFNRCQLCGYENDVVEFSMWTECDAKDKPERGNIVILCKRKPCQKILNDHPRLYIDVPTGDPGHFMLLCGDCIHRDGLSCTHKDLKKNGGEGLLITLGGIGGIICLRGSKGSYRMPRPAVKCAGKTHLQLVGDGGS